jgi:anti-sigma regulatory factor (Ser/Thr protein kinase)
MGMSPDDTGGRVVLTVASNIGAARFVREAVERLRPLLDEAMYQDLRLLLSELVVNAVRHSGVDDPIGVNVHCSSGFCRAEVLDRGSGFQMPTGRITLPEDAEAGYGMVILTALASRWGADRVGHRQRVWFELGGSSAAAEKR